MRTWRSNALRQISTTSCDSRTTSAQLDSASSTSIALSLLAARCR